MYLCICVYTHACILVIHAETCEYHGITKLPPGSGCWMDGSPYGCHPNCCALGLWNHLWGDEHPQNQLFWCTALLPRLDSSSSLLKQGLRLATEWFDWSTLCTIKRDYPGRKLTRHAFIYIYIYYIIFEFGNEFDFPRRECAIMSSTICFLVAIYGLIVASEGFWRLLVSPCIAVMQRLTSVYSFVFLSTIHEF